MKFSEEQKPLLVMEYLPLGSLACQDFITEEETLQILFQGLLALDYLHSHSPPLAHRDRAWQFATRRRFDKLGYSIMLNSPIQYTEGWYDVTQYLPAHRRAKSSQNDTILNYGS